MGLFGIRLPKKKQITDIASRAFDQANPFDNNRTFKQRTPTQRKSTFQQAGQLGGQTARGITTVAPQTLNSAAEFTGDTIDLGRVGVANITSNPAARNAALKRGLESKYSAPGQGLLGTGGLISSEQAQTNMPVKDLTKIIVGKGIQGGAELGSLASGGFAGKQLVQQGFKQGIKSQIPKIAESAALNTLQGGATAYNAGAKPKDIFKSAALSGVTGTAADVGLGVAGAATSKLVRAGVDNLPTKPVFADFNGKVPNDPLESLKQEVRKYKSAEEFVKAQGEPLYHGSPNHKIIRKEGFKSNPNGNNLLGEGVYMTRHRAKAENYSLPSDLPRGTTITPEMRSAGVVEGYIPKGSKIYQPETRAELKNISTKELQQQGFDGIEINGETVIFDQSKIKTREQLTDLYNQATAPQVGKTPTNIYDYNPTLLEQNRKLRLEQATGQSYADKFGVSPDQEITIYRGVPENAKGKITAGDWVTHDKEQARQFARQHKDGSKILTQKVKAGDIRYTADNATGYADGEFVYKPTEVAPQVGKTDPINAIKAESKRFGYDKGYLEEGQIANTVDELMKEQNAVREVGIPLYDKYKDQLDGTKTVTEMMTPSELKAYKAAEAKSEKASKLLKDYFDYKRSAKSEVAPQVGKTATSKLASDILKNEDIVRSVMNGGVFKMRLDNGKVVAFGEKSLLGRLGDSIGDDVTDVIPVVIGRGKSGTAKSGQPRLLIDEFEGQNGMVQLKRALGETDEPKTTVSQRLRERWGEPQKNSPSVDTNLPKAVSSDSIPQSAPQVGKTNPKFERDVNTGKMKMVTEPKTTANTEKYSIANSDISRTRSPGMNQDGFIVEDWGGKKRFVSLDGASTETKMKVRKAEAEYEAAKKANNGTALAAKQRVNDAYSDAIQDLKLQDYATTESGGRTFNSRYNDWLETKYKDRDIDTATIKDMAANPQKYRSQFEAETGKFGKEPLGEVAQQPIVTKRIAPERPRVEAKTEVVSPQIKGPARTVDEAIYDAELPKAATREDLAIGQQYSPDRLIRENITNPLEEMIQVGLGKMQRSGSRTLRGTARAVSGFFGETGRTSEDLAARRALHAGKGTGELKGSDIIEMGKSLDDTSKAQVWAALDPEQASKLDMKVDTTKFTPEQSQLYGQLKGIQDAVTAENLNRGNITKGQAANENYFKRSYSIFEENSDASAVYDATMNSYLGQFRGRKKDIAQEVLDTQITDPTQLMAKKIAESEAFWAIQDYGNYLSSKGYVSNVPKPGYTQLPASKLYGDAAGKYVPRNFAEDFTDFQYSYAIANSFNDLITKYDNWSVRKAKKEILTIFNPAVRLGNQVSNRVVFSNMNGINPVTFNKAYIEAGNMIKNKDPLYREAVEQGLTGTDVFQADLTKNLSNYVDDPGLAGKVHNWVKKSYSGADDKARIAAYVTHRRRGYSPAEAAKMTQRGFQDYKSVGFFYDLAAKTPIIGNAFVRFVADSMRIAKNAAVDHPLRTVGTIAMWSAFVNGMSVISGESELQGDNNVEKAKNLVTGASKSEDQKTREDRFGTPKIPFTDISLAVQTPVGEINVARFLPYYQLNEIQEGVSRYLPFNQTPFRRNEEGNMVLNGAAMGDPVLGQVAQLLIDEDSRQRSIRDPENTGQMTTELSGKEQAKNVARFLSNNNLPMGRELDNLVSSYGAESNKRQEEGKNALPLGEKAYEITGGKDIYGRERSISQSLLRAGGVKVEEFGKEQVKKQESKNQYYEERKNIENELQKLPKEDREAYKRLTGYYKLREKTPNEFDPTTDRYIKAPVYNFPEDKWKEYQGRPELYEMMLWKKNQEANRKDKSGKPNGPPLQPEFDNRLSLEFRKQLLSNKSLPPGEDVEADERLYSSSEWDTYQKLKDEYKEKAAKYYPKRDEEFKDEMVKHKSEDFPEKPRAYEAYTTAYQNYVNGNGDKPAYNDAVDEAKQQYIEAKREWTNRERKARGLPPISKEVWNNVTFGFESDEEKVYKELKYGKGYGGYGWGGRGGGGGGSGKDFDPVQIATAKYLKAVSSKKSSVRPTVSKKASVKLAGKQASTGSKPKVTMKKSRV